MRILSEAACLVAILAGSCAARSDAGAPVVTPAGVRFVLNRPEARRVAVAGSFNQWSTSSHALARDARTGLWTTLVALPPGEHTFMFVVDGAWIRPPVAENYVDDGFGARNGVVVVGP
jgi:1,4-alpha-glucan branching enzyme